MEITRFQNSIICLTFSHMIFPEILLQNPTFVRLITGIEGLEYQASDGLSVIHALFFRDFTAMGCSSCNLMLNFPCIRLSKTGLP